MTMHLEKSERLKIWNVGSKQQTNKYNSTEHSL